MPASARPLIGEVAKDHPLSDEEIVRRVRDGEIALFEVLMRRHNRRLYRVVRAILHEESEVEDVMQQAYFSAYTHLAQFAGMAKFSTWLTKIAVNEAFARLRQRGRFVELEEVLEREDEMNSSFSTSGPQGPERRAMDRELGRLLEAAIDGLPQAYRSVFMLREIEALSTAETAECLDLSEEAVKVRLHRAKARLRDELYSRVGGAAVEAFPFQDARCNRVVAGVFERIDALPSNP